MRRLESYLHYGGAALAGRTAVIMMSRTRTDTRRAFHGNGGTGTRTNASLPAPKAPPRAVPALRVPRIEFAAPSSLTHEGIAYAVCPLCGTSYHMGDMLFHLTTAHKQLDVAHCRRICQARLNLCQKTVGVPLAKVEPRRLVADGTTPASGTAKEPGATITTATTSSAISQRMRDVLAQLPTVTPYGAYECNWCVQRTRSFPTRDAFLKHLLQQHPELPLDDLEEHIPLPPALCKQPASGRGSASSGESTAWGERKSGDGGGFFGPVWQRGHPNGGGPSRRLRGAVKPPTPHSEEGNADASDRGAVSHLPARQVGIVLPRSLDGNLSSSTATEEGRKGVTPAPFDANTLYFTDTHFPCELCGKAFDTELNLLQHLENKHPTGTAEPCAEAISEGDMAVSADVAKYQREEATGVPRGQIYALCDLCGASKVYTLPSALYAHIRFRHPAEDAAYQVERIIEASKDATPLVCPHCAKGFATQAALEGHVADKHSGAEGGGGGGVQKGSAAPGALSSALPPVTVRNRWWCNECEKGFGMAKALHGHMVSKHRVASQVFPCPACKRVFTDVYSLEEHFGAQHKSMSLSDLGIETHATCPECNRLFLSVEDLRRHTMRHHGGRQQQQRTRPAVSEPAIAVSTPDAPFATPEVAATAQEALATPRRVARRRPAAAAGASTGG